MLLIQAFLKEHSNDYKEILSQKPYCIEVKEKDTLVLFKYNQIDSDFSNPMVRECRGLILENNTWNIVCCPFFKFGNYGESYVPNLDWNTAKILEKIDGSLIKVYYYNNKWNIATNGTIDAYDAELSSFGEIYPYKNFGELAEKAFEKYLWDNMWWDTHFEKNFTYMFEIVSPYNKVVVPHSELDIYLIGIRDNESLKEIYIKNHSLSETFPTPKEYKFSSLEDCIENAKQLPFNEEGYVVVDKDFNRTKIKSVAYLQIHHLKGEGVVSVKRVLELVRIGEQEEFLTYFPEYSEIFNIIKSKYQILMSKLHSQLIDFQQKTFDTRKAMALYITQNYICTDLYFKGIDGKVSSIADYIKEMRIENLLNLVEKL